nr:HAMP domain-containing protein [Gemmatimonadaceae bacterium]
LETLGYLAETRTIGGGNSSVIEELIGEEVTVYLGNAGDSFWTDLVRPVDAPPLPPEETQPAFVNDAAGRQLLSVRRTVAGTPWQLVLQVPRHAVAAPARALLVSMVLAALVCLAVGGLAASVIGRRVTRPIELMARAATGIASGDYSRRVAVSGHDEMAHLARAFNEMAARVETATADLHAHAMALEEQVELARHARRDTALVRSLLEDVLASAPVGVALFDLRLRYLKANPAMAALNALAADDHIGNTPAQVEPLMGDLLEPLLVQVRASGATLANRRITSPALSGRPRRHWLVTGFPVRDTEDELTGVGVIVADTTAHQELEAQFLQAQKMEAVGRLAGGVAHDFNNLLTVILSYSSMAVDSLGEGEELRGDMIEIRDAAMRAAALTRQLLAFSRNQVLQPQQLNVNDAVRGMERLLERLLGTDVSLELRLADDVGDVCADPGQMEQVIMNLVVNARDAMPDGGCIVVATALGSVTAQHPLGPADDSGAAAGPCVVMTVSDTGTGMSEATKAHLFEPFFTTKPAGKGTGLGLATVYGIVTQSGGDVRADDNAGPGTTFTVRLPRAG